MGMIMRHTPKPQIEAQQRIAWTGFVPYDALCILHHLTLAAALLSESATTNKAKGNISEVDL